MKPRHVLALALLAAAAGPVAAQSSSRAGQSEFYFAPVFTQGKDLSQEGGTRVSTATGTGFSLGWAYNFDARFAAGIDFAWSWMDYRANLAGGPGNAGNVTQIAGSVETGTVRFNGTWNFFPGDFTPFLTGGLGWTHVYTDIPTGPPQNLCWYYPWYGTVCNGYVPTANTTKFSYNLGFGVRKDFGPYFVRGVFNEQWWDYGGNAGSEPWQQFRLDLGLKFR
jgi:hypothetical protein